MHTHTYIGSCRNFESTIKMEYGDSRRGRGPSKAVARDCINVRNFVKWERVAESLSSSFLLFLSLSPSLSFSLGFLRLSKFSKQLDDRSNENHMIWFILSRFFLNTFYYSKSYFMKCYSRERKFYCYNFIVTIYVCVINSINNMIKMKHVDYE